MTIQSIRDFCLHNGPASLPELEGYISRSRGDHEYVDQLNELKAELQQRWEEKPRFHGASAARI